MDDRLSGLIADIRCESCDGLLLSPRLLGGAAVRKDAAFVCIRCNRPYYWVGDSLTVRAVFPVPTND